MLSYRRRLPLAVMAIGVVIFLVLLFLLIQSTSSPVIKPKETVIKTVTVTATAAATITNTPIIDQSKDFLSLKVDSPISSRSVRLPHPEDPSPSGHGQYSKFRCSGNDNDVDGYPERVCVFEHICHNVKSKEFTFHARENNLLDLFFFESKLGEMTDFYHEDHGFVAVKQLFFAAVQTPWDTFAPKIVKEKSPVFIHPKETTRVGPLHVLWSTWAEDDNLGHLLWEEMASIWYSMIRMNVLSENVTAMHWPDDLPQRKLAIKFREAFFPAISSTPPVSFSAYIQALAKAHNPKNPAKYVCFDQLLVGGNVRRFLQRMAWHNYGQEPLFFSFRARILNSFNLDPYYIPKTHRIVITRKTTSNFHSDAKYQSHRSIHNIAEVESFIRQKYPTIQLDTIDFKDHTIASQLSILLSTTLLITPAGGISMVLPFLPDGAHAIVLDYMEKEDSWLIGTKKGESVSMEAPFWGYWPHVKKLYYQIRGKEDMVSDDPEKSVDDVEWRDEVSVRVNLGRLEKLIDMAFDHMAP
ncbi:hypothetical protein BC829DRAFT_385543 [Chytridium lagenaria]|nr:hypothetical protein BC829DRAFT_385543 [Chytridium lagenaria]